MTTTAWAWAWASLICPDQTVGGRDLHNRRPGATGPGVPAEMSPDANIVDACNPRVSGGIYLKYVDASPACYVGTELQANCVRKSDRLFLERLAECARDHCITYCIWAGVLRVPQISAPTTVQGGHANLGAIRHLHAHMYSSSRITLSNVEKPRSFVSRDDRIARIRCRFARSYATAAPSGSVSER